MQCRKLLVKLDSWVPLWYTRYLEYKRRKIVEYIPIFEKYIASVRAATQPAKEGIVHDWYGDCLYLTKTVTMDEVGIDASVLFSAPRYYYQVLNKAIKVPNVNDNEILREYWRMSGYWFCMILSWPACGFLLNYLAYGNVRDINVIGTYASFPVAILLLFWFCIDASTLCKIVSVPYIIFDNDINSLVYRCKDIDEVIPFHLVTFNVRQIEDSPAYCALEMEIHYPDRETKKIIMDFCESHLEAQSILNTYRALLAGNESIYHKKLKRYSSVLSDFNMPWWEGVCHFFRTTTDWYACVFPHYFGFRLCYGHPAGVLKKYIIEQELKNPLR
jgi:hypothetical protein